MFKVDLPAMVMVFLRKTSKKLVIMLLGTLLHKGGIGYGTSIYWGRGQPHKNMQKTLKYGNPATNTNTALLTIIMNSHIAMHISWIKFKISLLCS